MSKHIIRRGRAAAPAYTPAIETADGDTEDRGGVVLCQRIEALSRRRRLVAQFVPMREMHCQKDATGQVSA